MALYIHSPDYSISRAVSEMAEEIAALNNVRHGLDNQVNDLKSDLKYSQARLGELEKLIVSLQQECSTLQLKLKRRRKPNA